MGAEKKVMVAVGMNRYTEGLLTYATGIADTIGADLICTSIINTRDVDAVARAEFEHPGRRGRRAQRRAGDALLAHDQPEGRRGDRRGDRADRVQPPARTEGREIAIPVEIGVDRRGRRLDPRFRAPDRGDPQAHQPVWRGAGRRGPPERLAEGLRNRPAGAVRGIWDSAVRAALRSEQLWQATMAGSAAHACAAWPMAARVAGLCQSELASGGLGGCARRIAART